MFVHVTGPTHVLIGTTVSLGVCDVTHMHARDVAIFVVATAASSKLPDQAELGGVIRHRGPTHTLLACLVVWVLGVVLWLTWPVWGLLGLGLGAGYMLHLAADALTIDGVPGWPFTHRIHLLPRQVRVRTSSTAEQVLATFIALAFVALSYQQAVAITAQYG